MIDYGGATRMAYETIYKLDIDTLPIDPFLIAKKENITILSYSDISKMLNMSRQKFIRTVGTQTGALWQHKDNHLIIYNDYDDWRRVRWTVAHELGHYFMHLCSEPTSEQEAEANTFAKHLLSPFPLLFYLKFFYSDALNTELVSKIFQLSYSASENTLIALEKCSCYARSYLQHPIVDMFIPALNKEMKRSVLV